MARNKAQIKNLRDFLFMQIGPAAYLFSDEKVDEYGDRLQRHIWMNDPTPYRWKIQVRLKDDATPWEKIEYEKTDAELRVPYADLLSHCMSLMYNKAGLVEAMRIFCKSENFAEVITYKWVMSTMEGNRDVAYKRG